MQQFYNNNNNNFRLISILDEPTLKRFSCAPIGTLEKKKLPLIVKYRYYVLHYNALGHTFCIKYIIITLCYRYFMHF